MLTLHVVHESRLVVAHERIAVPDPHSIDAYGGRASPSHGSRLVCLRPAEKQQWSRGRRRGDLADRSRILGALDVRKRHRRVRDVERERVAGRVRHNAGRLPAVVVAVVKRPHELLAAVDGERGEESTPLERAEDALPGSRWVQQREIHFDLRLRRHAPARIHELSAILRAVAPHVAVVRAEDERVAARSHVGVHLA